MSKGFGLASFLRSLGRSTGLSLERCSAMLKVLLALDSRSFGGIETHVRVLAESLRVAGVETIVMFCRDHGPHPLKDNLRQAGLRVVHAGSGLDFIASVRRLRPDVIHTHGYKANILGRVASLLTGIPAVGTFHAGEPGRGKLRIYTELDRLSGAFFEKIAVSDAIARRLPGQTTRINNFVHTPPRTAILEGKTVLFVGRHSHEKGPDMFCQIASTLPEARFVSLGDGPMLEGLKSRYGGRVEFQGQKKDIADWLHQADLVLMPSRHEGLPMAALESMASGVPVVAFGLGQLPGLICHGRNGFLATPGDLDGLKSLVSTYLGFDPVYRRLIGSAARQTIIRSYSPEAQIPLLLEIYHRLLAGRKPVRHGFS